jgi:hypothetical protein
MATSGLDPTPLLTATFQLERALQHSKPLAIRAVTSKSRSLADRVRAAVFNGPRDVRIENVPEPAPPDRGEVLLEVVRAAICGTDAAEWDHGPILCRPGVVLGHEFVGRVVAAGDDVTDIRVGDRVVSGAGISCGHCRWCRDGRTNLCSEYRTLGLQIDGGLAERVVSPAAICRHVPGQCDDDAAAMAQPVAVRPACLGESGARPSRAIGCDRCRWDWLVPCRRCLESQSRRKCRGR